MGETQKTEGEEAFETYLSSVGLEFEFEKEWPGKRKRPDYSVKLGDNSVLLEMKDFEASEPDETGTAVAFDPYSGIRKKIEKARQKFTEFEDYCCCVVMYNCGNLWTDIESPDEMFGAMFGNLGISMKVDLAEGVADPSTAVGQFGKGGKLLHGARPQNTTISAVIALRYIKAGREKLTAYLESHPEMQEHKDDPRFADILAIAGALLLKNLKDETAVSFDPEEKHLGVIVYENTFAKAPLSREIFCGEYDERYAVEQSGKIARVFAGCKVEADVHQD